MKVIGDLHMFTLFSLFVAELSWLYLFSIFFLETWLIPGMCSAMRLWMELSKLKELKRMLRWTRERKKLQKVFFLSLFTFVIRIIAWNKRLCLFPFVGLQRKESLVSGWPPWKTMMLYPKRLVLKLQFVYLELLQS